MGWHDKSFRILANCIIYLMFMVILCFFNGLWLSAAKTVAVDQDKLWSMPPQIYEWVDAFLKSSLQSV